jgi:hypothetical protein
MRNEARMEFRIEDAEGGTEGKNGGDSSVGL